MSRLVRDVGAVIAAKLVVLAALYLCFFAERPPHDAPATAAHIMGER
ncbi:MAG: hypothetical protein ISS15_00765 [Alphaproteobacteria bacterium]|nr:hypothetical protein [Alphaproteobacteria bacterium]MBL6937277.1 hypothetical protein [Alphaproteobacteria bacterium]MBL7096161.1 hypothetical protein [Alphaproteobacteria bacterium]